MHKIIAVTSGKGGVGKSTFSVGVARALCRLSKKVLLVDLDSGFRCLDLMLGVSEQVVFDINDISSGKIEAEDAIIRSEGFCPDLIAAPFDPQAPITEGILKIIALCDYDFIIFDFPAGFSEINYRILPKDTMFITVSTPDPICVRDAAAICRALRSFAKNRRLVINRFDKDMISSGNHFGIDELIDSSSTRLIGVIPEDRESAFMLSVSKDVKRGKTRKAYLRIAERLCGKDIKLKLK